MKFPRPFAPLVTFALLALPSLAQGPGTITCEPGVSGVLPCPCANVPSGPGRGCDNSLATGGASLDATGNPSLSSDTILFDANFIGSTGITCNAPSGNITSVLYQGSLPIAAGTPFGDGVLCCLGNVIPLWVGTSNAGNFGYPLPGTFAVSTQSAMLGDFIFPGTTRCYFVAYRDACPTFCTPSPRQKSNSYSILWQP